MDKSNTHKNKRDDSFLDSLQDWIWEMDINGFHTYTNTAVESILAYTKEEIIGTHATSIWPENERSQEKIDRFNKELKLGLPWEKVRSTFQTKSGDVRVLESSGLVIFDDDGKLVGFRGVDRDVTHIVNIENKTKASEEKYRNLAEELNEANNLKKLLLDIISHDIKNPVHVIKGMTKIIMETHPEDVSIELLGNATEHLIQVVDHAQVLSKISNNENLELEPVDIVGLIEDKINNYRFVASNKKKELIFDSIEKPNFNSHPIISEIIDNYISNAIKYAPEKCDIKISLKQHANTLIFQVADEGKTIPKDKRKFIFERNTVLDKKNRHSHGLGLSIVQQISQALKLKIGVRPNNPQGNIFFVEFPI